MTAERFSFPLPTNLPTAPPSRTTTRITVPAPAGSGFNAWDALYVDGDELAALPPPADLIAGVLPADSYALLAGRDSTFKSFVALDWALSLATGTTWLGNAVETPCPVLYVAAEGSTGLAARRTAWTAAHPTTVEPGRFTVRRGAVDLFAQGPDFDDLLGRVESGGYRLVILDTLRRMSGAAGENSSEMGRVVDGMEAVKRATDGGTVLTIAHTGKTDADVRGFSGIEDDADVVWRTRRPSSDGLRVSLTLAKSKDGTDAASFALTLREVAGSLVVEADTAEPRTTKPAPRERVAGPTTTPAFTPAATPTGTGSVDTDVLAAMSGPLAGRGVTVTDLLDATGGRHSRSTIERARARLIASGALHVTGTGKAVRVWLASVPVTHAAR